MHDLDFPFRNPVVEDQVFRHRIRGCDEAMRVLAQQRHLLRADPSLDAFLEFMNVSDVRDIQVAGEFREMSGRGGIQIDGRDSFSAKGA